MSNSHVWMWELAYKEGWAPKNWCFQTVVLEKTLESPLDCKEIKPVNPKGNQPWIFSGKTYAEAPLLWPPEAKSRLTGSLWCWKRLKAGEGDNSGWDGWMASPTQWTWVWVNLEISDAQGGLVCCIPWGHRVGHDWSNLAAAAAVMMLEVQHLNAFGKGQRGSWSNIFTGSLLLMNIQGWFPFGLTDLIFLLSKEFSKTSSNTTVWKHQFFGTQSFLWSNSHSPTWLLKNH